MEKNQYELCLEVLRRLDRAGVLRDLIVIGSWCLPFYKDYFSGVKYSPTIRTRDVDFLIPHPAQIRGNVDIPKLLKDLGFVIGHQGTAGYMRLEHPNLIVEFLSPEKGRGTDKPIAVPRLGINAVALRYLTLLTDHTIKVPVNDFEITLPHPIHFALHKLIISQRRPKAEKAEKDRKASIEILSALISKGETSIVREVFDSLIPKWKTKVVKCLKDAQEKEILRALNPDGETHLK